MMRPHPQIDGKQSSLEVAVNWVKVPLNWGFRWNLFFNPSLNNPHFVFKYSTIYIYTWPSPSPSSMEKPEPRNLPAYPKKPPQITISVNCEISKNYWGCLNFQGTPHLLKSNVLQSNTRVVVLFSYVLEAFYSFFFCVLLF